MHAFEDENGITSPVEGEPQDAIQHFEKETVVQTLLEHGDKFWCVAVDLASIHPPYRTDWLDKRRTDANKVTPSGLFDVHFVFTEILALMHPKVINGVIQNTIHETAEEDREFADWLKRYRTEITSRAERNEAEIPQIYHLTIVNGHNAKTPTSFIDKALERVEEQADTPDEIPKYGFSYVGFATRYANRMQQHYNHSDSMMHGFFEACAGWSLGKNKIQNKYKLRGFPIIPVLDGRMAEPSEIVGTLLAHGWAYEGTCFVTHWPGTSLGTARDHDQEVWEEGLRGTTLITKCLKDNVARLEEEVARQTDEYAKLLGKQLKMLSEMVHVQLPGENSTMRTMRDRLELYERQEPVEKI